MQYTSDMLMAVQNTLYKLLCAMQYTSYAHRTVQNSFNTRMVYAVHFIQAQRCAANLYALSWAVQYT